MWVDSNIGERVACYPSFGIHVDWLARFQRLDVVDKVVHP